jgi:hypothetical protein
MRYPAFLAALALLGVLAPGIATAQQATQVAARPEFLFVGSYHMGNPGRDVHNTKADNVSSEARQAQIAEVARLLERYRPTKVMVEADTGKQAELDQRFTQSCGGQRPLANDEVEQLGFRIACDMTLSGVLAVDWNDLGPIPETADLDYTKAAERDGQQLQYQQHMAIGKQVSATDQQVLDGGSVGDMLVRLNSPEWLAANASAYYRIGLFGSATQPTGANWMQYWYGRNLAIFNNIARRTAPGDRILVIYGAGHGNLIRQMAADSGAYRVHDPLHWLRVDPH